MHARHRDFELKLRDNEVKRKPFNAKINEQSLQNATMAKERRDEQAAYRDTLDQLIHEDSPGAAELDQESHMDLMGGDDVNYGDDIDSKMRLEEVA